MLNVPSVSTKGAGWDKALPRRCSYGVIIVWNVTTNKLILLLLMDIVQVGNNAVIDWLVFALEHTDLSKIIVNNPTGLLII